MSAQPSPQISLLLRGRGRTTLVSGEGSYGEQSTLPDAEVVTWSPDGSRLALATAASVLIYDGCVRRVNVRIRCFLRTYNTYFHASRRRSMLERCAVELPLPCVSAMSFSPDGARIVTWHRKPRDDRDEPNLLVHDARDGRRLASFHQRVWDPESWPTVSWTADGVVALRTAPDGVHFFAGGFDPPEPLHKLPADGVTGVWAAGSTPPYRVLTFVPRSKSRPAAAALWAYPPPWTPLATKALQADAARAAFAPDASAVLVEMSTSASDSSYYGDSRLFLLSRDGRISISVPGLKDGPTHDFCWGAPRGDIFVVIAGKSPPVATLHDGASGAALFSFGSGAFNTARISPQGRFLMLGGFGNMAGDVIFWDVNKRKPLSSKFNAPCTVSVEWRPDGHALLTATTRPRLNVDNGFRVYSLRGELLHDERHEVLLGASWRPARASLFPDRPASPPQGSTVSSGDGTTGALGVSNPTPIARAGAAYVPPQLRAAARSGGVVGAGVSPLPVSSVNIVAAMMREDHVGARTLSPNPAAGPSTVSTTVSGKASVCATVAWGSGACGSSRNGPRIT